MRTLFISVFALLASFSVAHAAGIYDTLVPSVCTTPGAACTSSRGVSGTCKDYGVNDYGCDTSGSAYTSGGGTTSSTGTTGSTGGTGSTGSAIAPATGGSPYSTGSGGCGAGKHYDSQLGCVFDAPIFGTQSTQCTVANEACTINGNPGTCLGAGGYFTCITSGSGGTGTGGTGTSGGTGNAGSNTFLINPLAGVDCTSGNGRCLETFLGNILAFIVRIGTIVVILMLIFVGYKFVMAQGVPAEISAAKNMLLWTIVGALVLLGAQAISMGILATVQALSAGR